MHAQSNKALNKLVLKMVRTTPPKNNSVKSSHSHKIWKDLGSLFSKVVSKTKNVIENLIFEPTQQQKEEKEIEHLRSQVAYLKRKVCVLAQKKDVPVYFIEDKVSTKTNATENSEVNSELVEYKPRMNNTNSKELQLVRNENVQSIKIVKVLIVHRICVQQLHN